MEKQKTLYKIEKIYIYYPQPSLGPWVTSMASKVFFLKNDNAKLFLVIGLNYK
jgi:hypothetical protein